MTTSAKHKKRNDLLLILLLLVLALSAWLVVSLRADNGAWVVVTQDGVETARYELSKDWSVIIGDKEKHNQLVIANGKADVTDSNCPDKLCVHQSAISKDGQSIICLPHKLVISIEGGEANSVDAVAD